MSTHTFNVVKDSPDKRDHIAPLPALILPSVADLRPYLGPIKNQSSLGSCTAHAGTSLREFLYRRFYAYEKDKTVPASAFRLSPLFQYAMEREIEGDFSQDGGAESRTIFQALSQYGCCLESQDQYDVKNVYQEPSTNLRDAALPYRFISYHRCMTVPVVKSVLASGYVVTVGTPVFASFESDETASTGRVRVPTSSEPCLGGHEMLIVGYNDGQQSFTVQNSWGLSWGENGFCLIPYAYFTQPRVVDQVDFWTAHLGKPWV
jgi:C1A family cysteine protease